ncbi:hypothetical protein MRB53_040096 [Persea americana]|nr:hypothetical protein MRB53_040096 [Persea americana]
MLFDLLGPNNPLVRSVQEVGPKMTESLSACNSSLRSVDARDVTPQAVANTLLYLVSARDRPPYDARPGYRITKAQFKHLYDALLPLAHEYENLDLQLLWGGEWRHSFTQLAFTSAFLSLTEDELDATHIPRLRTAFSEEDFRIRRKTYRSMLAEQSAIPWCPLMPHRHCSAWSFGRPRHTRTLRAWALSKA